MDVCARVLLAFPPPGWLVASTSAPPQIIKLTAKYLHLPDIKRSL